MIARAYGAHLPLRWSCTSCKLRSACSQTPWHCAQHSCTSILHETSNSPSVQVSQRIDAGDHYIVYGTIEAGEVLDSSGVSAVHHRKAGNTY